VYESFESDGVAHTGVAQLPEATESALGGHAVMAVGYDDSSNRFLVRNSWGAQWGMGGYFTIPYAYLTDDDLADDFWTIRVVK
jgi:C1A family cysteine protease